MLKVSVITVVFNNKATIRQAVDSVLSQDYPRIEYIIIDGGSTDGTVETIKSYGNRITKLVSEPDKGIYDAMNKGLNLAGGEIIGFLNSDDRYVSPKVISRVVEVFERYNVDSCYGDLDYVTRNDKEKIVRHWRSLPYKEGLFKKGWYPPHPSFFVKKNILHKYGGFDLVFKISADYELTLRLLEKYKISSYYIPEVLVKMRVGGESNRSVLNIIKANIECYNAWKKNGLKYNLINVLSKPLTKAKQYIRKP